MAHTTRLERPHEFFSHVCHAKAYLVKHHQHIYTERGRGTVLNDAGLGRGRFCCIGVQSRCDGRDSVNMTAKGVKTCTSCCLHEVVMDKIVRLKGHLVRLISVDRCAARCQIISSLGITAPSSGKEQL